MNETKLKRQGYNDDQIRIYLDALRTYEEAQQNLDENGTIVAHPKTGAPMENPYLKIRERASKVLLSFKSAKNAQRLTKMS